MTKIKSSPRFFVNIIPGMESMAYLELCERWVEAPSFFSTTPPQAEFFKGGIEFSATLEQGYQLNHGLRTSNRILLRWQDFPAENIKIFKQNIAKLAWSDFFKPGSAIDLQFSSRSSKLSHKKQIIDVLEKALTPHKIKIAKGGHRLFVRIFRDHCQISIDTTGERGQFRGQNKKVGRASLRDNTAACLIRILCHGLAVENYNLVDPMMGSGTFLSESAQRDQWVQRDFAYQEFAKGGETQLEHPTKQRQFNKLIGFERDGKTFAIAEENLGSLELDNCEIYQADVLKIKEPATTENNLLILNPPWGKRLQEKMANDWLSGLLNLWRPARAGVLWTSRPLPEHQGYKVARQYWLENSGVRNQFVVLIPDSAGAFAIS